MHEAPTKETFLGNGHAVEIVWRAMAQERLPHAMIFSGLQGVGKQTLALLLARALNCLSPRNGQSCEQCRSCRKILAHQHPDVRLISPEGSVIRIEQIRNIIGEIVFQPFEGSYRVVIIDPADKMKPETANCLLKTLEEPPSRTFIILITVVPHALLGTIRSRCRLLHFAGIPRSQIVAYLTGRDWTERDAELAALSCEGSLARALEFDLEKFALERTQALHFVSLLLQQSSVSETSQIALSVARDREGFPSWIDTVGILLQDVYYARVAPERIGQTDIAQELQTIAAKAPHSRVVAAIHGFWQFRQQLLFNVNRQLGLESLYMKLSDAARD